MRGVLARRGLRALGMPFAVVGALVPELALEVRPPYTTNDADVTVAVQSLADFETLKDRLANYGFERTLAPQRMLHQSGGRVDILPFSKAIAPEGRLELVQGVVLNMAGFEHVVASAVETTVDDGPTLPVVPLPLYALLKLVAFNDRKAPKDLAGTFHCLRHYLDEDERRYGAEHEGQGVPFEYTGAYLLGFDGRRFLGTQLAQAIGTVLDRFADPDADAVGIVARERGQIAIGDEDRADVFEHFRWYRNGIGVGWRCADGRNNLYRLADKDDVVGVTKKINGGVNGLAHGRVAQQGERLAGDARHRYQFGWMSRHELPEAHARLVVREQAHALFANPDAPPEWWRHRLVQDRDATAGAAGDLDAEQTVFDSECDAEMRVSGLTLDVPMINALFMLASSEVEEPWPNGIANQSSSGRSSG